MDTPFACLLLFERSFLLFSLFLNPLFDFVGINGLLGRSTAKLERVLALSRQIVQDANPPIHIEAVTEWCEGLEGADYVLNQVQFDCVLI